MLSPNTLCGKTEKREELIIEKGKRTRAYAYTFRATEEEKEIIDTKLKQSGRTMTDFIIRSITDKPIVSVASGAEILSELKRQGNNLIVKSSKLLGERDAVV